MRREGTNIAVKTRKRTAAGSATFTFAAVPAIYNGTTVTGTPGTVMYHGRMWRQDHPLTLLAEKALDRYGAQKGPLNDGLEIDVAFCSDSAQSTLVGGWDVQGGIRVKFYAPNEASANVLLSTADQTVIAAYGAENTITAGTPDAHAVTSTDQIPLWVAYIARNQGSIVVGVGSKTVFEVGKKKWHSAAEVLTFDEFPTIIDLSQFTWVTLYFSQILRVATVSLLDVWLQRIFIDGNTGEWGDLFDADLTSTGPNGKANNTAAGSGQYSVLTVGGVPGIDSAFQVEIAEVRLWDGERYTAAGGGDGDSAFSTYLSSRIPPNDWDKLWLYARFAPLDVNDMAAQTTMDQLGTFAAEKSKDAIAIYQGAEVISAQVSTDNGSNLFIPFPSAPSSAIKGIQIFRSQVVPVADTYPSGDPNPNATLDAFKVALTAPLHFLTEVSAGTGFYFDTATDDLLGSELNLTEGLIPKNPGGIFEWAGFLGIWVTDRPRIHFSEAPGSWESYPQDMLFDLPLREKGSIQAAAEMGARDARQSRVLLLGKSWGVFLEGNPTAPRANTIGGGVGAASSRCLVLEGGIAYAYNGALWAISGDGSVADIGRPVLDLLPDPDNARLSISGALSSLFVIDETTGIALRFYFPLKEWFVEDRYALSVTDIDGQDAWVHLSGYPALGTAGIYGDDVDADTAVTYLASSISGTNFVSSSVVGLSVAQRGTLVAEQDPRQRQVVTITSIVGSTVNVEETLTVPLTWTSDEGVVTAYVYHFYVGVGEWGTMLDTGPFVGAGFLDHADIGVVVGDDWYAMLSSSDYYPDPSDRSAFDEAESAPTRIVSSANSGESARLGLRARQRIQRFLVWNPSAGSSKLSEVQVNQTPPGA